MKAEKRIAAIANCCAESHRITTLTHVHIRGNIVEASDGSIYARTEMENPDNNTILVLPGPIMRACENLERGGEIAIEQKDGMVFVSHTTPDKTTITESMPALGVSYPDTDKYFVGRTEIYFAISAKNLEKLVCLARSAGGEIPHIIFHIAAEDSDLNPIRFNIHDNSIIGIVMPVRILEKNT